LIIFLVSRKYQMRCSLSLTIKSLNLCEVGLGEEKRRGEGRGRGRGRGEGGRGGGGGDTAESAPGQSYSICRKYISFINIVYYSRI
jgi:hypothetical protein